MKAPIFIIGTGRSGTTILFKLLKEHPSFYWLSHLMNRYPDKIYLNDLMLRIIDYPILGKAIKNRLHPAEAYPFWDKVFLGFKMPCRDLFAEDVTPIIKTAFQDKISKCFMKSRKQFIAKFTGWPRIGFLQEIFPGAKFIHIIRDGRAVANSLLNYPLWNGWYGPERWRWGSLPNKFALIWEKHQRSFLILAAIQWVILEQAFKKAIDKSQSESVLSVKYEKLCSDPIEEIKSILDFCELEWSQKLEENIKKYKIISTNNKWKKDIPKNQKIILQEVLNEYLNKFGYPCKYS